MSKAPWYKRYAADFMADPYVQAMTAEQYGWFSAMLDQMWVHTPQGYLPNDMQMLCKMVGRCDEMHFTKHAQIVIDRFKTTEDGKWIYHPKMLEQVEHVCQVSEKRRDAANTRHKSSPTNAAHKQRISNANAQQKQTDSDSDSDSDKPLRGDEALFEIAKSYPTLSLSKDETDIPQAVASKIFDCVSKDGAVDVLAGVKGYAASLENPQFAMDAYKFFSNPTNYRKFIPVETQPKRYRIVDDGRRPAQ